MRIAQIEVSSTVGGLARTRWILVALALSAAFHVGLLAFLAGTGSIGGRSSAGEPRAMRWVVLASDNTPSAVRNAKATMLSERTTPVESSLADASSKGEQPPPAPTYLPRGMLQQAPVPISEIDPVYPDSAGGLGGSVVLRLRINEGGAVDSAEVVSASRPGLFDQAAIEAFKAAKFEPGRVLGRPVKSELVVEVAFATVNKGAVRDAIR